MGEGSLSLRNLAPNSQVVVVLGIIAILWVLYLIETHQRQFVIELGALRHDLRAAARGDIGRRQTSPEMEEEASEQEDEEGNADSDGDDSDE